MIPKDPWRVRNAEVIRRAARRFFKSKTYLYAQVHKYSQAALGLTMLIALVFCFLGVHYRVPMLIFTLAFVMLLGVYVLTQQYYADYLEKIRVRSENWHC